MCKALQLKFEIATSTQYYTSSYDANFGKHDTCNFNVTLL